MQGSAGVPPFSHHMDALEGAVSIFFPSHLSVIYPGSSVFLSLGLLFLALRLKISPRTARSNL